MHSNSLLFLVLFPCSTHSNSLSISFCKIKFLVFISCNDTPFNPPDNNIPSTYTTNMFCLWNSHTVISTSIWSLAHVVTVFSAIPILHSPAPFSFEFAHWCCDVLRTSCNAYDVSCAHTFSPTPWLPAPFLWQFLHIAWHCLLYFTPFFHHVPDTCCRSLGGIPLNRIFNMIVIITSHSSSWLKSSPSGQNNQYLVY